MQKSKIVLFAGGGGGPSLLDILKHISLFGFAGGGALPGFFSLSRLAGGGGGPGRRLPPSWVLPCSSYIYILII